MSVFDHVWEMVTAQRNPAASKEEAQWWYERGAGADNMDRAMWARAWKTTAKKYRRLLYEFMAGKYVIVRGVEADDERTC